MTNAAVDPASYQVLLIGIDEYAKKPLAGCVNDIDAVQRILVERAGVPRDRIRRLASPRGRASGSSDTAATLANLRSAFTALAGEATKDDRVFIYYSGHGTRVEFEAPGGRRFHREALVPTDCEPEEPETLLYDHELNELLARLTARTSAVTFVLDCCHSAGVTRDLMTPRVLDARSDLGLWRPVPLRGSSGGRGNRLARSVDDCHVIAACLDDELAREALGNDGKAHGLLTHALATSLAEIPDRELTSLPWSRIWQRICHDVEQRNPDQHPWMSGHPGRGVLAGEPVLGDPGFRVRKSGRFYEIDAGTLASVTVPAVIAVYGEQPATFPPVGSDEDRETRLGVVRVINATPATATAVPEKEPFEIPTGARGRIVEAGAEARLPCAIVPPDKTVVEAVAASPLLQVVDPAQARVWLRQVGVRWVLCDDAHAREARAGLCTLAAGLAERAREVLEHYFSYSLPLRMAEAARDLPGALELTVLSCPEPLSPSEAESADLMEAPSTPGGCYDVLDGAGICFRVKNRSRDRLRVTLVNCGASGRVQILDEHRIDANHSYTFWADSTIGMPFEMTPPDGKPEALDWLVAIGTTGNKDVRHLGVDRSFAEILTTTRGHRDARGRKRQALPVEQWTATRVLVKTRARP